MSSVVTAGETKALLDVAWISRVGLDRPGALVREALEAEDVDVRWVVTDEALRGAAVVHLTGITMALGEVRHLLRG